MKKLSIFICVILSLSMYIGACTKNDPAPSTTGGTTSGTTSGTTTSGTTTSGTTTSGTTTSGTTTSGTTTSGTTTGSTTGPAIGTVKINTVSFPNNLTTASPIGTNMFIYAGVKLGSDGGGVHVVLPAAATSNGSYSIISHSTVMGSSTGLSVGKASLVIIEPVTLKEWWSHGGGIVYVTVSGSRTTLNFTNVTFDLQNLTTTNAIGSATFSSPQ